MHIGGGSENARTGRGNGGAMEGPWYQMGAQPETTPLVMQ